MAAMGRSLPEMATKYGGQVRCNGWSVRMQTGGQVSALLSHSERSILEVIGILNHTSYVGDTFSNVWIIL